MVAGGWAAGQRDQGGLCSRSRGALLKNGSASMSARDGRFSEGGRRDGDAGAPITAQTQATGPRGVPRSRPRRVPRPKWPTSGGGEGT